MGSSNPASQKINWCLSLMVKNNYYGVGVIGLKSKNMLLDQIVEHNECHINEKILRDREICVCRCRCRCRTLSYTGTK